MVEHIQLAQLSRLEIREGETVYIGGDQEWYPLPWQRQAGCGPTNCAQLLRYLAATREGCRALCPYDASEKPGFLRLMEEVWAFVTPGKMGVNTTRLLADGGVRYGGSKGVALKARTLDIPRLGCGPRDYDTAAAFVREGLAADLPVAFLNLSNGSLTNLDSWHWVTIVALRGDEALIYDQGQARWIQLRQWHDTSMMGGGFVTLDAPE